MIEQVKTAYINYGWVKAIACLGIVAASVLLSWLSGGFPPWAWRFLFEVLPQLPRLWEAQGANVLFPLAGLLLLSIALLILWGMLIIALLMVIKHWWHDFHAHQHFALDLQEAERMALGMVERAGAVTEQVPLPSATKRPVQEATPEYVAAVASRETSVAARSSRLVRASGAPALQRAALRNSIPPTTSSVALRERLRVVPRPNSTPGNKEEEIGDSDTYDTLPTEQPESTIDELADMPTRPEEAVADESGNDDELVDELATTPEQPAETDHDPHDPQATLPRLPVYHPGESLRLTVGIGLDAGIARKHAPNEDNVFAIQATRTTNEGTEPVGLFVVADGMGGHTDGQEASRVAIHAISDAIVPSLLHRVEDEDNFADLLKEGAYRANLALYRRNRQKSVMMGTTLTAALIVSTTAYIANVGDSRTYLYRPGKGIKQITRDHSVVARLVEDGKITKDEIYTHPKRNQIYRCLGENATVEIDNFVVPLQAGDVLLLCSDGLWEMVRDPDIKQIMASSASHPAQISNMLVQAALSNGGADNVSVIVVGLA